jgi:hypothetical protein
LVSHALNAADSLHPTFTPPAALLAELDEALAESLLDPPRKADDVLRGVELIGSSAASR